MAIMHLHPTSISYLDYCDSLLFPISALQQFVTLIYIL